MQHAPDDLVYADASALSRGLLPAPEAVDWLRFADQNADRLVTSELGVADLRRLAATMDPVARRKAWDVLDSVRVVRISDQALDVAAHAAAVAPAFTALHLGVAVGEPDVVAVATYDALLARVCDIYAVEVLSPGRPSGWWAG